MRPYSLILFAATGLLLNYTCLGLTHNGSTGLENHSMSNQSSEEQARVLWEQAIAAKGGREKLLRVKNMVISSRAVYETHLRKRNSWNQERLLVFPDKEWHWTDMRPDVFGLRVEMYNYEMRIFYILTPEDSDKKVRQIANYKRWEESTLSNAQILYFMETSWVKPLPIAAHQDKVNGQPVDIVQTEFFGQRIDFALHKVTHLPVRISYYNKSITGRGPLTISNVDLSEYVEVDGIKIPRKVTPENSSTFNNRIQINVDYNEEVFVKPTTLEAGPETWRPKKK